LALEKALKAKMIFPSLHEQWIFFMVNRKAISFFIAVTWATSETSEIGL
jgi:hypothetical protein